MGKQAFQGKRLNGFYMDPNDIVLVGGNGPVDVPKDDAPAHFYDKRVEDPLDPAMVKNFMVYGVIEPIIVSKYANKPYCVDGRLRVLHLREANKKLMEEGKEPYLIPFVTKKGNPAKLFGILISANENRRDDNPMAKAEKLAQYMDMGKDEHDAATAAGCTPANVYQLMKLFELHPDVQELVRTDKIKANAALELLDLDPKKQVATALALIESGKKPTARRVRKAVGKKPVAPSKKIVKKLVDMEEKPAIRPKYDSFWGAIQFMLGEISIEDVGLEAVIEELKKKKTKKASKPETDTDVDTSKPVPAKKKSAKKKDAA
jgi:ParB family chromosome partitioning protein